LEYILSLHLPSFARNEQAAFAAQTKSSVFESSIVPLLSADAGNQQIESPVSSFKESSATISEFLK
jgi:hypothetical protein